uniref:Calmodulin n=1 Tax=Lotharella globosa TaxID=91324 RepID=A0A7S3Z473_9EUKA
MADDRRQELKAAFDSMDEDGLGALSYRAISAMLRAQVPNVSDEQIEAIFQQMDEDGDDTISFEEFHEAAIKLSGGDPDDGGSVAIDRKESASKRGSTSLTCATPVAEPKTEVLAKEDDDDDFLSPDEKTLKNYVRSLVGPKMEISRGAFSGLMMSKNPDVKQDFIDDLFDKYDSNKNGSLSFDELLQGFREVEDAIEEREAEEEHDDDDDDDGTRPSEPSIGGDEDQEIGGYGHVEDEP